MHVKCSGSRQNGFFGHDVEQLSGHSWSGVYETDSRACNFLKDRQKERVMRTAKDNGVRSGI